MNFFTRFSQGDKVARQPVPQAILDAVDVMGGRPVGGEGTPLGSGTSSHGASPFFQSGPGEAPANMSFSTGNPEPLTRNPVGQGPQTVRGSLFQTGNRKMFMVVGGAVLVAVIAGLVAWYFFRSSSEETAVSVGFVEDRVPPVVTAPEKVAVNPPYASDAPNYLTVDSETVTPESFGGVLSQTGAKMLAANMVGPVEFLLTDKNNNPLAFSRFAYLMNIGLSEELLASLGERFSLYLYSDNGMIRIGLALMLTDAAKGSKLIATQESSLPFFFRTVLFQGVSVARELGFRSGVYKTASVRFVNVDAAQGVSFDYVLRGNEWFIGTSKDTLRMMLDKRQ